MFFFLSPFSAYFYSVLCVLFSSSSLIDLVKNCLALFLFPFPDFFPHFPHFPHFHTSTTHNMFFKKQHPTSQALRKLTHVMASRLAQLTATGGSKNRHRFSHLKTIALVPTSPDVRRNVCLFVFLFVFLCSYLVQIVV